VRRRLRAGEVEVICHCCGQEVPQGSAAEHGMLINEGARLGARIMELTFQLQRVPNVGDLAHLREALSRQIKEAERERGLLSLRLAMREAT
jgi:hypothetical protein